MIHNIYSNANKKLLNKSSKTVSKFLNNVRKEAIIKKTFHYERFFYLFMNFLKFFRSLKLGLQVQAYR